ncbi:hypothetical protein SCREM1_135 [Synechococcus phage S-CREM1]|nr:hypothetical protein SCREM1_135 [Synechococcus phage S-CREM1]
MKLLFHKPPEGYHYERTDFKKDISAIWIVNDRHFDYCGRSGIQSIWGFYNSKTKQFHAPVNSKTVGSVVDLNKTTAYSAMQKLKDKLTDTI